MLRKIWFLFFAIAFHFSRFVHFRRYPQPKKLWLFSLILTYNLYRMYSKIFSIYLLRVENSMIFIYERFMWYIPSILFILNRKIHWLSNRSPLFIGLFILPLHRWRLLEAICCQLNGGSSDFTFPLNNLIRSKKKINPPTTQPTTPTARAANRIKHEVNFANIIICFIVCFKSEFLSIVSFSTSLNKIIG